MPVVLCCLRLDMDIEEEEAEEEVKICGSKGRIEATQLHQVSDCK